MAEIRNEYGVLINGKFVAPVTGEYMNVINPANGKVLAQVASGGNEDVDKAIDCAEKAGLTWGKSTKAERARILNKIADIIEQHLDHIAKVETMDTGKTYGEAKIHLANVVSQFHYFAGVIEAHEDIYVQHDNNSFSLMSREPLGVCAMIIPWNAPSMLLSWKVAPALAGGNTIVLKPASAAPLAILEICRLCQEVLPPGVLNVVTGPGSTVGDRLVHHPKIAKISFTGSTETGKGIGRIAGEHVVPATLELGGKSANIVFPDATINKAEMFACMGILSSAGEICVAGSRLFLHESIHDDFLATLKQKFEAVKVGDPMVEGVQMGPITEETQMQKILAHIETGVKEGATLVCGGKRLTGPEYDNGFFIEPTIFADVTNDMRIAQEEIFGPVLVVIKFTDENEVIAMANDSSYGLAAGIWTNDIGRIMRVSRALQAGLVWVNDYLNACSGGSFGGYKKSGLGREVHRVALDYYTNLKNTCVSLDKGYPPAF
ncbi:MAG: aldehyde dehydrogenase family protein [Desulfopila sp.]